MDRKFFILMFIGIISQSTGLLFGYRKSKPQPENKFLTCADLSTYKPRFYSGVYHITLPSGYYEVYCEMGINGGGYTFISDALLAKMTQEDLNILFRNQTDVLLRISKPDGSQPYTVIRQLKNTGGLRLFLDDNYPHKTPVNENLGSYLLLDTIHETTLKHGDKSGLISNSKNIEYTTCGNTSAGHFAFCLNPDEKRPSLSHEGVRLYETKLVAVDWRESAKRPYSARRMPLNYFFFTELHFGKCGTYTSSDRWLTSRYPALGTAIGVR